MAGVETVREKDLNMVPLGPSESQRQPEVSLTDCVAPGNLLFFSLP